MREVEVVEPLARAGSCGPDGVLRLYLAAVVQDHLLRGDLLRLDLAYDLDLEVGQLAGRAPERGIQLLEDLLVAVHEDYADAVRVYVRVVRGEDIVDELVQLEASRPRWPRRL